MSLWLISKGLSPSLTVFFSAQIRKNDFIKHIKQSNLMTEFKQTDPSSDLHWQKVICLAFRSLPPYIFYVLFFSGIQCLLKIFQGIISIFDWNLSKVISLGSLISTMMVSSTRKSFVGWPLQTWSVQRSFKRFFRWFINHFLWLLCDCNHF